MTTATIQHSPVDQALRHSPILSLRTLSIKETIESVVLLGNVPSYYAKQIAQETVMPFLAGRRLINRIVVERPC